MKDIKFSCVVCLTVYVSCASFNISSLPREYNGPVLIASPDGGMDIEEVAEKTPERLLTKPIDIYEGMTDDLALEVADFLKFDGPLREKVSQVLSERVQVPVIFYHIFTFMCYLFFRKGAKVGLSL